MIFTSISYLKTLILLKFSQCNNLNNCNVWLQRCPILYLKVYFTNKPMVQQWDHLLDPPWLTHFCHTMWKTWLNSCPQGFKPVFYLRHVDDIFVLFKSNEYLKYLQEILNSCHISMSFSMERERQNNFFFLDIEVIHKQGKFSIIIYRKPTFSGAYSNFESFLPSVYKFGMVYTLLFRCFCICSDWKKFHAELTFLKKIFCKNGYLNNIIDKCSKKCLDNIHLVKEKAPTVERRRLRLFLTYLGVISLQTRTEL